MVQTATAISIESVVDSYLDAWNSDDPAERAALLLRSVDENVVFIDPMKQLIGRNALETHIADVRAKYAGIRFSRGGEVDAHTGVLRAPWVAELDGAVVLRGLDVDDIGPDGRLTRILGFFDKT